MNAYQPLDLTSLCNAGHNLGDGADIPFGEQQFQGLPFLVGGASATVDNCLSGVGLGHVGSVRIPVDAAATHVVVAHRLLESQIMDGGPVGEQGSDRLGPSRCGRQV